MDDLARINELMDDLRAHWFRLFEAIERARMEGRNVSSPDITWEITKWLDDPTHPHWVTVCAYRDEWRQTAGEDPPEAPYARQN